MQNPKKGLTSLLKPYYKIETLPLPAAACCCLLPAAACCCLLLPAPACCWLLPAAACCWQKLLAACCCLLLVLLLVAAPAAAAVVLLWCCCVGRGQHGTRVCNACHVATVQAAIRKRAAALNAEPQKGPNVTSETLL